MSEDIASIALRVDAREVKPAVYDLATLEGASAKAEAATVKLASAQASQSRVLASLKSAVKEALISQEQYNAAVLRSKAELGGLEGAYRNAVAEVYKLRQAQVATTGSAGQQRAAMQQLQYQLADVAQGFAMGVKPQMIFAQQGTQVVQALSLMAGSTGRLAAFFTGPWGVAITAGTVVLGALATTLLAADDATKKTEFSTSALRDAQSVLGSVVDLTTGKIKEQTGALHALALAQAVAGQIEARRQMSQASTALSGLQSPKTTVGGSMMGLSVSHTLGAEADVVSAFRDGTLSIDEAERALRSLQRTGLITEKTYLEAAKAVTDFGVASANLGVFEDLEKALNGDQTALKGFLNETRGGSKSLSDAAKSYREAYTAAEGYIGRLALEAQKVGLTDKQLRQLELARAKDAAATDEQRRRMDAVAGSLETAIAKEEAYQRLLGAKQGTAALQDQLDALKREAEVLGLSGEERAKALRTMETEAKITTLLVQIEDDRLKGDTAHAQELQKQIDKLREILALTDKIATPSIADAIGKIAKPAADAYRDSLARVNEEFREMARLLDNVGGAGKVLGTLLAISSKNYDSVASGQLGDLLSFILNQSSKDGKKIGDEIKDALDDLFKDVFGKDGIFKQTLSEVLQGAGQGMAAAHAVFGDMRTAGDIGAAIGGAAGKALGTAIAGPLGGAIGSVVGGLVFGAIGNAIAGSKKGGVTLNGVEITGTNYKNADRIEAATENATSIIENLARVAEQLGGTLGSVSGVSIGMRNDKWRVDPTGQGRVKGSGVLDFGDDAEGAAMAAMKLLIDRGVIAGIRASTQNVLSAGKDLETQINKALAWEKVLDEAEHGSNTFSAALKDLTDSFAEINKIAIEAKASTAELAEVQSLLIRKQQELIDQAMQLYRSTFYTDAENAAYAKKTISSTLTPLGYGNVDTVEEYKALVAATDALANPELFGALMELSDEFGVLKDSADQAAAAAEAQAAQEKALAQQRGQIEAQILQAQGRAEEALAKQRALEMEAADPSLRGLLQQLYKAQDIATAKDALSEAYKRESAALQDVIDTATKAAETWQSFSDSLAGTAETAASTSALLVKFMAEASAADVNDPSKLTGAGSAYLDALRNSATSYTQYQRGVGVVRGMTAQAIAAAAAQGSIAQQQLDTMKGQVGALIDINESVLSVEDAIDRLTALVDPATPSSPTGGLSGGDAGQRLDRIIDGLQRGFDALRDRLDRGERWSKIASDDLAEMRKIFRRSEAPGGGFRVVNDEDIT